MKDDRQNDSITKPYALATRWGKDQCVPGYKLIVSPDSPEAVAVATKVRRMGRGRGSRLCHQFRVFACGHVFAHVLATYVTREIDSCMLVL